MEASKRTIKRSTTLQPLMVLRNEDFSRKIRIDEKSIIIAGNVKFNKIYITISQKGFFLNFKLCNNIKSLPSAQL